MIKFWQRAFIFSLAKFVLAMAIVQSGLYGVCAAQNFTFPDHRKKGSIDFELINNLIIVPVYINQKGPFNFILDTGVGPIILTDPKLVDSIGLSNLRQIKISGFGIGNDMYANVGQTSSIAIGEATSQNKMAFVLKEDLFNLSGYLGRDIAGLIGYDFFKDFVVKIDYPNQHLSYFLPGKKSRLKGDKIPFELINNKPYITATIENEALGKINIKLIVDCGASHAISLETYNNEAIKPSAINIEGNLGVGLSGPIKGHIGRTPSLTIGRFTFNNVLTSFPSYDEILKTNFRERNGNLGADILKRFNITFDYQHQVMSLEKNSYYSKPFENDMSGIEISVTGSKKNKSWFISRIEVDSPAEKADLRVNDEILSFNFKYVGEFTVNEVSELLKSGDHKTVLIEVIRGDKILVKLIKLRKRV